ncbi:MAG TPA: phenylalanine--tRNA ligase subunit alpha [Streptosporangiaceae bacterium]|jgi:phenylalanyl-tRNA synthetase alpha chain
MSAPNKSYDPVQVTALTPEQIERVRDEALAAIAAAASLAELKDARLAHAADRSPIAEANAEIRALPPAARAEAGRRVGAARAAINAAVASREAELTAERDARVLEQETVDVTLPWDRAAAGARHPVTVTAERLAEVFTGMGYEIAEGPEVEAEWFSFDALNFPPDHPARDMQDTFFVAGPGGAPRSGVVLRPHTSPVQIRAMLSRPLPIYVVSPGKCYRTDTLDATHSPVFHQMEALAVDEGLTMADLRGAISAFVAAMFGDGLRIRLRPDFFPFTEPSADVSMECHVCRGASAQPGGSPCRVCRSQGWVEIAGCGMVNPRVLTACGIDPDRYSGFAFGLGVERTLMIRHGVSDIRDVIEGDVRFSRTLGVEE